jgi:hypothetical protein
MLIPHRRKNAQLGEGRRAPDKLDDASVFFGRKAVLGDELGRDDTLIGHYCSVPLIQVRKSSFDTLQAFQPDKFQPAQFRSEKTRPENGLQTSAQPISKRGHCIERIINCPLAELPNVSATFCAGRP